MLFGEGPGLPPAVVAEEIRELMQKFNSQAPNNDTIEVCVHYCDISMWLFQVIILQSTI